MEQMPCPKCLRGTVSLRDEHKYYGPEVGVAEMRKTLRPLAIDRTYTCNKCGYMETRRESLTGAAVAKAPPE
jgi:predicted RNA-binding Zn-ribbon protein involved in translation (DUF1610 family)